MAPSWHAFRENVFGVFYIMTEQNNTRDSSWGILRCSCLYLLDAGQVLKALFLKEYGWNSGITGLMDNFDFVSFMTNLVTLSPDQLAFNTSGFHF
jgi:hypothetical protein